MTREEVQEIVVAAIQEIAPEIEPGDIDEDEDIREECDLDSMDILNVLVAIKKSTGVQILEQDFAKVNTLDKLVNHLLQEFSPGEKLN